MKHDLCRTGRLGARTALALIGAAIVAVSAMPQSAAAQTERWTAREFQARVFGVDDAVDIAYWKDGNDEWIYMTGYQTTASGATVFATHKYDANFSGPGENEPIVSRFYPDPPAGATGTNRAVAIEVDSDGNVYVTGESTDPTGANGLDYVTIKYDKDLVPDEDWEAAGHADAVVRWDNPTFAGPGSHDSPVDIALGKQFIGTPSDNIIGITGRSYGGLPTRNDIVTVLMEAGTGNLFAGWPSVGGLGLGARSFNGSANGHDWPVGLDLEWQPIPEGPGDVYTVVAGTTRSSGPANNDIVTMAYDPAGNLAWTNVYNGPMDGDDVATAMVVDYVKYAAVFVCGYTPHYVGGSSASPGGGSGTGAAAGPQPPDTDYIVLGYNTLSGFAWGDWAHIAEPNVTGVRVWNGPGPTPNKSDDRAMDITLDGNPGVTGWRVWLTGRVREADGVGYDVATISYRILSAGASPQEVLTPFLPKATERGVAVTANGRDVYVTATIQPDESDLPLILTFKIDEDSGSYAIEWMRLFGYSISDIPSAIIAPTAADLTVPVFVAGLSYLLTTSHDQISLRYSQ